MNSWSIRGIKQYQLHTTQTGADYRTPSANFHPKWRMFRNVLPHSLSYLPSVININYLSLRVVKAESSHDRGNTATSKRGRYHNPHALVCKAWCYLICHGSKYSPLPFVLTLNTKCVLPLAQCFPALLHAGNLTYEKVYRPENREAVAGMRSLPYCQLPGKNSRDISRNIWIFSRHFKMFMFSFH